jgi:hypothetical protein
MKRAAFKLPLHHYTAATAPQQHPNNGYIGGKHTKQRQSNDKATDSESLNTKRTVALSLAKLINQTAQQKYAYFQLVMCKNGPQVFIDSYL